MKKLTILAAVATCALSFTSPIHAQIIVWGSAQNMVGPLDVSNMGTAFDAVDFYTTSPTLTVNSVTFTNVTGSNNDGKIAITGTYDTGAYGVNFPTASPSSTAYSNLVSAGTFGGSTGTVTLSGLTSGHQYQVESWTYYSGDGTATTTYSGATPVSLLNSTGQFAIGTFTATSTSEFYTDTVAGVGHNFINAVSVRDITATPEPSTWAMMLGGLAMLGFCLRRKAVLAERD